MAQGRSTSGVDVYDRIRELMRAGGLGPGDRVREAEVAARFGVSRTPVREAFRRLEAEGLLQHEPHRGMVVPTLDAEAVAELYVMREVLEGTAAALAAQHASDAEIAHIGDMVAADRALVDDPEQLARTNRRFHEAIYRAARNRYLVRSLAGLREALDLLGPTTLAVRGRAAAALEEHAAVAAAIAGRDTAAAVAAARTHVRASHRTRLSILFNSEGENT